MKTTNTKKAVDKALAGTMATINAKATRAENRLMNRINFVFFVPISLINPNGDPMNGGKPRTDLNGYGFWNNCSLKYKLKTRMVEYAKQKKLKGYNRLIERGKFISDEVAKFKSIADMSEKQAAICAEYGDIRMFGGMLKSKDDSSGDVDKKSKGDGGGILTQAINIGHGVTIDPIDIITNSITRCCPTNRGRTKKTEGEDRDVNTYNEMGDTSMVSFGLYRFEGSIDPVFAAKNGLTEADIELFFKKLLPTTFAHDSASNRGTIDVRKIIIWRHDSPLGNAPAFLLQNSVKVTKKEGIRTPTKYDDYEITVEPLDPKLKISVEVMGDAEIAAAWLD